MRKIGLVSEVFGTAGGVAAFLTIALVSACGGQRDANKAAAPPPATSASIAPAATSPTAEAPSAPHDRLALVDTVLPSARIAVHVDVRRLRDTPLFTIAMTTARVLGAGKSIDEWTGQCGFSPIEAVDEVLMSGDDQGVIAARVSVPADRALNCLKLLGHGEDASVQGQPAVRLEKSLVVASGDLLVASESEELLGQALARKGGGATELAKAVMLGATDVAAVHADIGEKGIDRVDARLVASASELAIHARFDCKNESTAQMIAGQKDTAADMVATATGSNEARDFVKTIGVRQEGKTVFVDMGVQGDAHAQAQYVGTLASIAISGVRQYLAMSKTAEARASVGQIATQLSAYAEEHGRFPPSAPPVPKIAPRATKYQSSPKDWSGSWKTIKFEMDAPQYYSYSFVTAPDGKSVTVTAHGDLNGDGKVSTFELKIEGAGKKGTAPKRGRLSAKDETE